MAKPNDKGVSPHGTKRSKVSRNEVVEKNSRSSGSFEVRVSGVTKSANTVKSYYTPSAREDPMPPSGAARRARSQSVLKSAHEAGLQKARTAKLAARVDPDLLEAARASAGVETDSELVNVALANLAIEDGFVEAFRRARGVIDPELDLEP